MTAEQTPAALAGQVTDMDPTVGLRAVVALRRLLEELERRHVDNARAQGWSWQTIATALGVSRQSVHEKHGSRHKATSGGHTATGRHGVAGEDVTPAPSPTRSPSPSSAP